MIDAALYIYKSLVGSSRYLTCIRPDILYAVGLVSQYMVKSRSIHWKVIKYNLHYKRYYIPWYTFYDLSVSNLECLLIRIVIGIETWMIGKAPRGLGVPIVTLSTCNVEYVRGGISMRVSCSLIKEALLNEINLARDVPAQTYLNLNSISTT